jgi:hypothetical protein
MRVSPLLGPAAGLESRRITGDSRSRLQRLLRHTLESLGATLLSLHLREKERDEFVGNQEVVK